MDSLVSTPHYTTTCTSYSEPTQNDHTTQQAYFLENKCTLTPFCPSRDLIFICLINTRKDYICNKSEHFPRPPFQRWPPTTDDRKTPTLPLKAPTHKQCRPRFTISTMVRLVLNIMTRCFGNNWQRAVFRSLLGVEVKCCSFATALLVLVCLVRYSPNHSPQTDCTLFFFSYYILHFMPSNITPTVSLASASALIYYYYCS